MTLYDKHMSEQSRNLDQADLDAEALRVRVEYGGYAGVARLKRVGHEALKWEISIHAANGRQICYWDGPDVEGDGLAMVAVKDIENAQHQINEAIEQFMWDPMSQA